MTDYEKAVVTAYTGKAMLCGEKLGVFYDYVQKLLGRPVWTHELADHDVWEEIHAKSKDDFIELCADEPLGKWVSADPFTDTMMCNKCGFEIPSIELATPHCQWCGIPLEGADYETD